MIRLFAILFFSGIYGQILGPADVSLSRLEKCGEDSQGVIIFFYKHKINRTHDGIDFNFTLPFAMDELVAINLTAAKWGDGGWKPNYFDIADRSLCRFMYKYAEKTMRELSDIFKVPQKCPFPAGKYSTDGYVYDGYIESPVMYGDFMIDLKFLKEESQFACVRAFVSTKPKKTNKMFGR